MTRRGCELEAGRQVALKGLRGGTSAHPTADKPIVLLTRNLSQWTCAEAAQGANAAARRFGYRLISLETHGVPAYERECLTAVLDLGRAGVILCGSFEMHNIALCQEIASRLPTVQSVFPHPDITCDVIDLDPRGCAVLVVKHLVSVGYRRVGHITYRGAFPPGRPCMQGYLSALKSAGLAAGEGSILQLPGGYFGDARYAKRRRDLLRYYLQQSQRPRAVFVVDDRLAIELIGVAWELGLSVSGDLAVAGCLDQPTYSLTSIPLTTVRVDLRRVGMLAVERIIGRLKGDITGPPAVVRVEGELVVRDSTLATLGTSDQWARVLRYLEENFRRPITVHDVAQVLSLAPNYFSARFGQVFGRRYTSFLRELRLDYARELLATTNLTIEHIAHAAGFRSTNYFFKVFRKTEGSTPLQYRAQHRPPG